MAKLSAFADEVTDDFKGQIEFLTSRNTGAIELRFVNGKSVLALSKAELKEVKNMLTDNGIKVSAIGSPIGKVRIDEPFEPHLDKFKHSVDLAVFFQTPFIRMFSYYAPAGKNIDDCRHEVIERMFAKVEAIKNADVVMVHENETGIFGHSAENCADLARTINSPKLRLAYDPANFVWGQKITDNITSCWPIMKPYVVHIHIKDWKLNAEVGSIPGAGNGQIPELLAELAAMNYHGWLTMEPHLELGGQFGGHTGPELFTRAIEAVRQISTEVGLKCE
ncbi:MAG: sugar phosphate isomerase/epimerase family protein [Planctomycetota bacterium]|jgi:sugar phosphate isomerase/epimerase